MTDRQIAMTLATALCILAAGGIGLHSLATTPTKPTNCTPTKADMAPFRFPRTRFPLPVMFRPMDEAEPS